MKFTVHTSRKWIEISVENCFGRSKDGCY